ncbi:hypothetical protein Pcinc_034360 [Petrolisthes cinctipes]|uniref:RRM domain-containing protein n=1 Tax=Petrolisthes cinctipes TaxID=88211 RepID=A0AAE1JVS4_PETCI|nr:hypothetical protein Pcinc_034360 [Petrolisthes cinctipes]
MQKCEEGRKEGEEGKEEDEKRMEYEVEKGKEGDDKNEEGEGGRKDEKRMEYEVEKGKEGDNVREENEEGEEGRKDEKRMEYEVEKGKEGDDVREENEEYPMKSDEVIQVLVEEVMRPTVVFGTSSHLDLGLDHHASQPVTPRVLLLVTDQLVEDHFAQCGKVRRVSLLKKEDGNMKVCGFAHFNNKSGALNAIKECNMKPLLERPIAVDLFVPKSEYDPANVKQEIKEECDEDDDDVEDDKNDEKSKPKKEPSKDVSEGRTLFIKNLSFIATEEDISEVLARFGEVKSINLCMDRDTGHPRGTAFAQYQNRESADACLAAEADTFTKSDFILHGRPMYIMRAVSRKELDTKKSDKTEQIVHQGTKAVEGMSKADLLFRMRREQVKRQTLKNLHIFLSKTRLCIFNLPQKVDSKKLKNILEKYSPKEAKITECQIMKNLMDLDDSGQAKSRDESATPKTEEIKKSDTESGPSFMGAKYNPDNKKLPKHLGPKNRYRDRAKGKITRNRYRREKREQKQGKKRKSPQQGNEDGLPPKKKARKGGNKSQDMNTSKKGKKSKKSQFGRDLKVKKKPKKFKKLRQ